MQTREQESWANGIPSLQSPNYASSVSPSFSYSTRCIRLCDPEAIKIGLIDQERKARACAALTVLKHFGYALHYLLDCQDDTVHNTVLPSKIEIALNISKWLPSVKHVLMDSLLRPYLPNPLLIRLARAVLGVARSISNSSHVSVLGCAWRRLKRSRIVPQWWFWWYIRSLLSSTFLSSLPLLSHQLLLQRCSSHETCCTRNLDRFPYWSTLA